MANFQNSYSDPHLFFPNIPEDWGDENTRDKLKRYLDIVTVQASEHPEQFRPWRPDCQLTPNVVDIIFKGRSLRGMADNVNRYVTNWWRTEFADASEGAFTLHDYVLGTDMVRVAIDSNLGRAREREEMEEIERWMVAEEEKEVRLEIVI